MYITSPNPALPLLLSGRQLTWSVIGGKDTEQTTVEHADGAEPNVQLLGWYATKEANAYRKQLAI